MVNIQDDYKPFVNGTIFLIIWVGIISLLSPFLALTLGRGAELNVLIEKVQTYYPFAIFFGTALWVMSLIMTLNRKFPKINKKLGWMGALVNNYDDGLASEVKQLNFLRSPLLRVLIFLPLFVVIGFFGISQTGIPFFIEEQATETGRLIISIEPAGSEIFILVFIISLIIYPLKWVAQRKNWSKETYWSIAFPSSVFIGLIFGLAIHSLRYGESDANLFAVAIFWTTASLLIVLFGSIILAWIYKDVNNFFQKLKSIITANDTRLFITIILFVFIWLILLGIYFYLRKKRKEK